MDTFLFNLATHCHALDSNPIAAIQLQNNIKARTETTEK